MLASKSLQKATMQQLTQTRQGKEEIVAWISGRLATCGRRHQPKRHVEGFKSKSEGMQASLRLPEEPRMEQVFPHDGG